MLDDTSYMQHALGLARRQLGITWPNPAVGAVIVKDGTILGRGATAKGGRPHAETQAIAQAGKSAKGATLYVTLEPCSHHGKTPPCAEAVIAAGITRVIIGCTDPNPNVSGGGIAALKAANIDVLHGICEAEAKEINAGFFKQITRGIPLIAIKIATTLDGNIATGQGESQWITGNEARRFGHLLRAQYDAILTGSSTVKTDDPMLTCRLAGLEERSPVRVVLDTHLSISESSQLVQTAKQHPTWIITANADSPKAAALRENGVKIIACTSKDNRMVLKDAFAILGKEGITRMLVEAGGTLTGEMLKSELVDRIYWFRAPFAMGSDGMCGVNAEFGLPLSALTRYTRKEMRILGNDIVETYEA